RTHDEPNCSTRTENLGQLSTSTPSFQPTRGTGFPMMSQISLTCLSASCRPADHRSGQPDVAAAGDAFETGGSGRVLALDAVGLRTPKLCLACAVSIRCYVYSSILGDIGTEVTCPSGVTSCFKQDMTVLGVRIINGNCGGCNFTSTGCHECNTDLCNSGHRSVVASASVRAACLVPC
uniref:UPAR/Ly6 domain-containing protein n=1 Tax=Macrostomum lignano TaxID=282301 RepID=A0A1I8F3T4_9PLAT